MKKIKDALAIVVLFIIGLLIGIYFVSGRFYSFLLRKIKNILK